MAAHRYWRVLVTSVNTGYSNVVSCAHLVFREFTGGPQVATGGTAFASGTYSGYATPDQAFAGTGVWANTDVPLPLWIGYDFGAGNAKDIAEVAWTIRNDGYPEQSPNAGKLQFSDDGSTWTDRVAFALGTGWGNGETRTFNIYLWSRGFSGEGPWHDLAGIVSRDRISGPNIIAYNGLCQIEFFGATDSSVVGWTDCFIGDSSGGNLCEFVDPPLRITVAGSTSWIVNPNTIVLSDPFPYNFSGQDVTIGCCFGGGSQNAPVTYDSSGGNGYDRNFMCNSGEAYASSTGSYPVWFSTGRMTLGRIRSAEGAPPPPPVTTVRVTNARVFSIFRKPSISEQISSARVFGIYRFPAQNEQVSSLGTIGVVKRDSPIEVSQIRTIAVVKGRIANPKVRAWTFTLDGHDFYVLRLGDKETLVYDTASKQWVQWDSPTSGAWRPNIGTAWIGAQKLGFTYGSDIVAGDDTFGLLWFLDPRQAWDDATDAAFVKQQIAFSRVVTGQVLASSRQQIPCYAIFLSGDNYGLVATDFVPSVLLETSDDQGRTFDEHDTLIVTTDENDQPDTWYSLGQFGSPGRIFRVTDNGVYARIDAMDMNDDAG